MTTALHGSWRRAREELELPTDGVHVWRATLSVPDEVERACFRLLGEPERERLARLRFDRDRRRYAVSHGMLRRILGLYLATPAEALQFEPGPQGKPGIAHRDAASRLEFNLAHAGDLALVAVAVARRIGVDVEERSAAVDVGALESQFSPREGAALHRLPPDERPAAALRCWTRKEAYIKATGLGLSLPLDAFEVSVDETVALLDSAWDPDEPARWSLCDLDVGPSHAAALCVEGRLGRVDTWEW